LKSDMISIRFSYFPLGSRVRLKNFARQAAQKTVNKAIASVKAKPKMA